MKTPISDYDAAQCMPAGTRREFVFRVAQEEFERRGGNRIQAGLARYEALADAGSRELARLLSEPEARLRVPPRDLLRALSQTEKAVRYLQGLWESCFRTARLRLEAECGAVPLPAGDAFTPAPDPAPQGVGSAAEESPEVRHLREQLAGHSLPGVPGPLGETMATAALDTRPMSGKQLKYMYDRFYRKTISPRTWKPLKERALRERMGPAKVGEMMAEFLQAAGQAVA